MNTTRDVRTDGLNQEQWPELLELSTKEVFQIMLSAELEGVSGDAAGAPLECTAMVGLAGHLCGVLSFRCSPVSAAIIASKMLEPKSRIAMNRRLMRSAKSVTW